MLTNTAITADYVIVGAGLTGAVIAHALSDANKEVVILERRHRCGGNVADTVHPESGIRYNVYGPHYFRTNSKAIWSYANRFVGFYPFNAIVKAKIGKNYYAWPIDKSHALPFVPPPLCGNAPANFEEAVLRKMSASDYFKYVYGYTLKQWGVEPRLLSAELAQRIEIRHFQDERFTLHIYQGMPRGGYTHFVSNMLKKIPCFFGYDYLQHRASVRVRRKLIFTGPLDEFFGFDEGRLQYRSQKRTMRYLARRERLLPCGQVNFPAGGRLRAQRILEWKHMMDPVEQLHTKGTLVTTETACSPDTPDQCEYPFPDQANHDLRNRYMARAREFPGIVLCGRLGTYQYFDMDTAIGKALEVARGLIADPPAFSYKPTSMVLERGYL